MKYIIPLTIGITVYSCNVAATNLSVEMSEYNYLCDNHGDLSGYIKVTLKNHSNSSIEINSIDLKESLPGISIKFNMIDDLEQLWMENRINHFTSEKKIELKHGESKDFMSPVYIGSMLPDYLKKGFKTDKISGQFMGKFRYKNNYIYTNQIYIKNIKKCKNR